MKISNSGLASNGQYNSGVVRHTDSNFQYHWSDSLSSAVSILARDLTYLDQGEISGRDSTLKGLALGMRYRFTGLGLGLYWHARQEMLLVLNQLDQLTLKQVFIDKVEISLDSSHDLSSELRLDFQLAFANAFNSNDSIIELQRGTLLKAESSLRLNLSRNLEISGSILYERYDLRTDLADQVNTSTIAKTDLIWKFN